MDGKHGCCQQGRLRPATFLCAKPCSCNRSTSLQHSASTFCHTYKRSIRSLTPPHTPPPVQPHCGCVGQVDVQTRLAAPPGTSKRLSLSHQPARHTTPLRTGRHRHIADVRVACWVVLGGGRGERAVRWVGVRCAPPCGRRGVYVVVCCSLTPGHRTHKQAQTNGQAHAQDTRVTPSLSQEIPTTACDLRFCVPNKRHRPQVGVGFSWGGMPTCDVPAPRTLPWHPAKCAIPLR